MGSFMRKEQIERHTPIQRIFQEKNSAHARREELQRVSEAVNSFGRPQTPIPEGTNPNTAVSTETCREPTWTDKIIESTQCLP